MDIEQALKFLELDKTASIEDAEKAYKIKVRQYLHDTHINNPAATANMHKANEAIKEVRYYITLFNLQREERRNKLFRYCSAYRIRNERRDEIGKLISECNEYLTQADIDAAVEKTLQRPFAKSDVWLHSLLITNMKEENAPSQTSIHKILECHCNQPKPNAEIIKKLLSMTGNNKPSQKMIDAAFQRCSSLAPTEASLYINCFWDETQGKSLVSPELINNIFSDKITDDKNANYVDNLFARFHDQLANETLLYALETLSKNCPSTEEPGSLTYFNNCERRLKIIKELSNGNRPDVDTDAIRQHSNDLVNACRKCMNSHSSPNKFRYRKIMLDFLPTDSPDRKIIRHIETLEKERALLPKKVPGYDLKTKKIQALEKILSKEGTQRAEAIRQFNKQRSWMEWAIGSRTNAVINNTRTWKERFFDQKAPEEEKTNNECSSPSPNSPN